MQHTNEQIERATQRFEQLAEQLDPETARVDTTDDLREIAVAAEPPQADQARLLEAVQVARMAGPGSRSRWPSMYRVWAGGYHHVAAATDRPDRVRGRGALV